MRPLHNSRADKTSIRGLQARKNRPKGGTFLETGDPAKVARDMVIVRRGHKLSDLLRSLPAEYPQGSLGFQPCRIQE
ncbi:hypothetical protein NBRC116589_35810 [Ruegeria sp. HU-ET01832]